MKINLDELAHNPAVQQMFRSMKCMSIKQGDDSVGTVCTAEMDEHGRLTLSFEKPVRTKFKRFDDVRS